MDNQVSNTQVYVPYRSLKKQPQFQGQNNTYSEQSYGASPKDAVAGNTNVGYVASKFDVMQHPAILIQNLLMGLAASFGITKLGEYLVKGNLKKVSNADTISHEAAFQKSPLFKFGKKLDTFIENTPFLKNGLEKAINLKNKIFNAPKHQLISEIGQKYKDGSKVTWSMGKFYEIGKTGEAPEEFIEYLEKAPKDAFKDFEAKAYIDDMLEKVKSEKISKAEAGKEIVKSGCLDKIPSKYLEGINIGETKGIGATVDKICGTTPNLNSSLAKAKFFSGEVKGLGPISKTLNKLSLMMMEGVGGGLLGGKAAMFMSVAGVISAFNACSKAKVAKKEKQKQLQQGNLTPQQIKEMQKGPRSGEMVSSFMEDFAGFTLGGYLMTYPIGVALNKFIGLANLGRDSKAIKDTAEKLGVQGHDKLYQRSIIKYNDAIKNDKTARTYIDYLEGKGKLPLFKRIKKALGFVSDASIKAELVEKLKLNVSPESKNSEIVKALQDSHVKSDKWFADNRQLLKTTGKSQLTLGSVFKETAFNKGSFEDRLGRYIVHKPLEVATKILGFDKFIIYKKGAGFTNTIKRIGNTGGGVGRIALVGLVLTVPFRNAFMKISHSIFGKPSFSQYDEVKGKYDDDKIKKQAAMAAPSLAAGQVATTPAPQKIKIPVQPPVQIMQPQATPSEEVQQVAVAPSPVNPYINEIKPQSQDSYTYVPKNEIKQIVDHPVRKLDTYKYIPN